MISHVFRNQALFLIFLVPFAQSILYGQEQKTGSFTDPRDGKTYKTVNIGGKWWMAENLNYETEEGSWCMDGDADGSQNGRFYDWETAKVVSPPGWHLPSKQEFEKLAAALGVPDLPNWNDLYPLLIEGGSSGFNVQLTGSQNGNYGKRGKTASFWSSGEWWFTSKIPIFENPWRLSVRAPNYINIGHGADSSFGFNVRCIKDE